MNQINIQYYKTNYGEFILGSYDEKLCMVDFRYRKMRETVDDRLKKGLNTVFVEQDDEILQKTRVQLDEYFRAVANANAANAIGIIIPCHRIIGTNGELTYHYLQI